MGGKKKPTLSQLVKRQEREQREKEKKETRQVISEEKKAKLALVDEKLLEEIKKDIMHMNCITPYIIASKYGLKMSTATHILRMFRDQGLLYLVSKGHRTEIYVPIERAKALGLLKT